MKGACLRIKAMEVSKRRLSSFYTGSTYKIVTLEISKTNVTKSINIHMS